MAFGKTYLAGSNGLFRVYNHATSAWTDYSGISALDLYDVKTSQLPNFPNYAIIAGDVYIGYTTDAGATVNSVTAPVGTIIAKAYQISIPESVGLNNPGIYIAGSGIALQCAVIKSVDGGLTYTSQVTGLNTAFSSIARSIYFTDVDTGILGHGGAIAKTIDGANNWTYLNGGVVLAVGELVSGLLMSPDQQIIIATTDKKVYKSTNGGASFSVVYTWSDPDYYGAAPKYTNLAGYHPQYEFNINSSLWVSAANGPIVYSSDMGTTWSEVFPGQLIGDDNRTIFGASFYSATEGFFTYDKGAESLGLVYKATSADTTIVNTLSTDYFPRYSPGYSLWSTRVSEGCGCPPGSTYNETTGLCDATSNVCPDGSIWNPLTEQCEEPALPCLLDLTIVIDQSSSINASEQAGLKSLLYNIIDGIQDNGATNRITSDNIRIGLVTFGATGANLLDLSGGAGAWTSAPAGGTIKAAISGLPATPSGSTATFDGLKSGYINLTGTNSRNGVAAKRILLITDGWPNYSSGVAYNGINPGIGVSDNACPNVNPGNDPQRCANTTGAQTFTATKRQYYYATMELADDIKTATGSAMIDPANITLVVLGNPTERLQTVNAFIAGVTVTVTDDVIFPTATLLTNTTYFSVCNWDLAVNGNPSAVGNTNLSCKYWDAWYPADGSGGVNLPSNNANGDPDYFETTFDNGAAIADSIVDSLICVEVVPEALCLEPCVFDDQTGNCICSSDEFNPCCYDLLDCATGLTVYTVNTFDLGYDPLAQYVGQVINIEGTDECLFVEVTQDCTNSTPFPLDSALNITVYEDGCQECEQAEGSNPCYKLLNCDNQNVLYTRLNLLSYIGQTVTLNEYPEMCWQVLQSNICPGPFVYITLGPDTYKDCECCAQYHCN